jgi:rhodanese-related sulfurtransferase
VGLGLPLFLVYDGLGAVIWVGSSVGLGYVFSDHIEQALAYGNHLVPATGIAALGILAVYVLYKALSRRRQLRQVPRMTVEELAERLEGTRPPLVLDVRHRADAESEPGLPGALVMPMAELGERYVSLPLDRDLVLYCACPADVSSAQGALTLRRLGFERVWVLRGGVTAWHARRSGRPSVTLVPLSAVIH